MNKLLLDPTYKNKQGWNGLDLSHVLAFTGTTGYVCPVSWDFLQPDDKVRISCNLLTRTTPLLSSAFAKIEQNVRFFFVPFSQIFKPFENTFNGIQDFGSDFYKLVIANNRISSRIPSIQLAQVMSFLQNLVTENDPHSFMQTVRLLEMIGLPIQSMLQYYMNDQENNMSWRSHSINLLPLLAYQKIWSDYFRDSDRIVNDPASYNMDSFVDTQSQSIPVSTLSKVFTLRKCPVIKDINSNIYVSPLFGEAGVGGDGGYSLKQVNNWLTSTTPNLIDSGNNTDNVTPSTVGNTVSGGTYVNNINVASIRAAFATNKLLEITRRAKKHYDAQILAHYGVKVPVGVDGEALDIGTHTQLLEIGAVISQAETNLAKLGEIGGKGYSSETSPTFEFEAKTHGVLMAVYYARPQNSYYQFGLDKKLMYTKVSDFPRIEYEDLGMQPVFGMNQELVNSSAHNSEIRGWQYRYSEVKAKTDFVVGALARTRSAWVVSRNPTFDTQRIEDFYVPPTAINQILDVPYDESWHQPNDDNITQQEEIADFMDVENTNLFDTDPFYNQLSFDYRKSTKLSTYGIANL